MFKAHNNRGGVVELWIPVDCAYVARAYSETRFSKKLVFPCKEIKSMKSNGLLE